MVLELNASDDRGIGIVRQQIQDFVSTRTIFRCTMVPCCLFALPGLLAVADICFVLLTCSNKYKLVILDECDAMTKDAQFALRRGMSFQLRSMSLCYSKLMVWFPAVVEKYVRNARFCLICNYVSKIIPALQSRCTRFRFPPLGEAHVRDRLQHIIDSEQ